jgi:hypothetical protein
VLGDVEVHHWAGWARKETAEPHTLVWAKKEDNECSMKTSGSSNSDINKRQRSDSDSDTEQ